MTHFDVRSLVDMHYSSFHCPKCLCIYTREEIFSLEDEEILGSWKNNKIGFDCRYCKHEIRLELAYLGEIHQSLWDSLIPTVDITASEFLAHSVDLAIGGMLLTEDYRLESWKVERYGYSGSSKLGTLISLLNRSKYFIHFMSFRISEQFVGILKSASSRRVNVSGIVSGLDRNKSYDKILINEMEENLDIASHEVRIPPLDFESGSHAKLIVIDGVLAIKGSANLTNSAWRKADDMKEIVEVEFNPSKVAKLNNAYFAPVWDSLAPPLPF